jgi:hypothetical protein
MTQQQPAADIDAFDEDEFDLSTLRPADVRVGREPKSALSVRFDAADIERLRERSATAGVGITQLVRTWVLERLDEPEPSAAVGDLMEALERSLRAARTIKRASGTQKQAG